MDLPLFNSARLDILCIFYYILLFDILLLSINDSCYFLLINAIKKRVLADLKEVLEIT